MIEKEAIQQKSDDELKFLKDKRNEMESYIFSTREAIKHHLAEYIENEEREMLLSLLHEAETWLYSGTDDLEVKDILIKRGDQIYEPGNKVYNREKSWVKLTENLKNLDDCLKQVIDKVDKEYQIKQAGGLTVLDEDDFSQLSKIISSGQEFMNNSTSKIQNVPKFADPNVSYDMVFKYSKEISDKVSKVFRDSENRQKELERKIKEQLEKEAREKKEREEKEAKEMKEKAEKEAKEKKDASAEMMVD